MPNPEDDSFRDDHNEFPKQELADGLKAMTNNPWDVARELGWDPAIQEDLHKNKSKHLEKAIQFHQDKKWKLCAEKLLMLVLYEQSDMQINYLVADSLYHLGKKTGDKEQIKFAFRLIEKCLIADLENKDWLSLKNKLLDEFDFL